MVLVTWFRYLLRVTVAQRYGSVTRDFPFWVRNYQEPPQTSEEIKVSGMCVV